MKIGVNLKIDVSKIDKSKLFKGAKGTYLDMTAFIDIDNQGQYGDNGMIVQAVSKEEKAQGIKGAILGNAKVFWKDAANDSYQAPQYNPQQPNPNTTTIYQREQLQAQQNTQDFDDDIPF